MSENLETPDEINKKYTGQKREEVCNANQFFQFENGKCDYIPCEYLSIHACDNPILKNRCNVILDSNNVPKCKLRNTKFSHEVAIRIYTFLIFIYSLIIMYIYRRHNKILNKNITGSKIFDLVLILLFCIMSWFVL